MKTLSKIIISITLTILLSSCSSSNNGNDESIAVINADKKFCQYSVKEGFLNALLKYADVNIVKLDDGKFPVIGKKELTKLFGGRTGTKDLIWEPVHGEVAESGELGYTWGNWHLANKDTIYYGNYFTMWKKQNDGSWKVLLDGGNSTPPPVK